MEELKPCPFCGNKSVEFHTEFGTGDEYYTPSPEYYVLCKKCWASGPRTYKKSFRDWDEDKHSHEQLKHDELLLVRLEKEYEKYELQQKQKAIDAWNKRS